MKVNQIAIIAALATAHNPFPGVRRHRLEG